MAASPLELPLVLEVIAHYLQAPALVAALRVSTRWRSLMQSFDDVWTDRVLHRWPVPRTLVAPDAVCAVASAAPHSCIPNACEVYCARRRCESHGLELLDYLCDPRPQTPEDWSAAYCALLNLPPAVADLLRREHQKEVNKNRNGVSPMARQWLTRLAWNALCLQQVSAEAKDLASAAAANDAQTPIEAFPIAMAGIHHRGLGGPAGRAVLTGEIDAIADSVRKRLHFNSTDGGNPSVLPRRRPARVVLHDICAMLFREPDGLLGGPFRGASPELYYQPSNSSLASVLRLRRGNPITLSIVLLAVARRLGIQRLFPVGAPGHFVCVYAREDDHRDGHAHDGPWIRNEDGDAVRFFVDPYNSGELLGPARMCDQVRSRIPRVMGDEQDCGAWLQPAGLLDVWVRTLNNLRGIYARTANNPHTRSETKSEAMLAFFTITTLSIVVMAERGDAEGRVSPLVAWTIAGNLHAGRVSALAAFTLGRSWQELDSPWAGDVPNAVTLGPPMQAILEEDREFASLVMPHRFSSGFWGRLAPPPPPSDWGSFGGERGPQFMVGTVVRVRQHRGTGVVTGYKWIQGGYQYLVLADKSSRLEGVDESHLSRPSARVEDVGEHLVDNSSLGRYFLSVQVVSLGDLAELQYEPNGVLRLIYPIGCVSTVDGAVPYGTAL